METMTNRQAKERGMHKYFTGRPCNKGHLTLRYANTGACIECIASYARDRRSSAKKIGARIEMRHEDDLRLVREYAAALNAARDFMIDWSE